MPNLIFASCVLLSPPHNLPPASLSTILCSSFSSCFPASTLRSSAHLFPNRLLLTCSVGYASLAPALTVSFIRVSPVSSLSLRHSPAPTTWTRAQPQHRPAEERNDHIRISRRSTRSFSGENRWFNSVGDEPDFHFL